jgi:hypothetical protein
MHQIGAIIRNVLTNFGARSFAARAAEEKNFEKSIACERFSFWHASCFLNGQAAASAA